MPTTIIIVAVVVGVGLSLLVLLMSTGVGGPIGTQAKLKSSLSRIVAAQRSSSKETGRTQGRQKPDVYAAAQEGTVERVTSARITLEKRLRYAQWKLPPLGFRVLEISISLVAFYLVSLKFNRVMTAMALLTGPLFMRWLLNMYVEKRFKAFDEDYAPFLLSLVSLLKTGMNAMTALEHAAEGLEEGSLVKEEVRLMLERLRYGVSEDRSIGSFGEDIAHSEIELFVQALLLSRRVGGTLSDTLERLARQVRRRAYFREQAVASVGMQRGSIWFIIGIMISMETYLYFVYPQAVVDAIKDDMGWQVWQFGITVILLGIYWVRQVTKIRV